MNKITQEDIIIHQAITAEELRHKQIMKALKELKKRRDRQNKKVKVHA